MVKNLKLLIIAIVFFVSAQAQDSTKPVLLKQIHVRSPRPPPIFPGPWICTTGTTLPTPSCSLEQLHQFYGFPELL